MIKRKFKGIMVYRLTLLQQCKAKHGKQTTTQYRLSLRYTQAYYNVLLSELQLFCAVRRARVSASGYI